jgi:hypothetical protein
MHFKKKKFSDSDNTTIQVQKLPVFYQKSTVSQIKFEAVYADSH